MNKRVSRILTIITTIGISWNLIAEDLEISKTTHPGYLDQLKMEVSEYFEKSLQKNSNSEEVKVENSTEEKNTRSQSEVTEVITSTVSEKRVDVPMDKSQPDYYLQQIIALTEETVRLEEEKNKQLQALKVEFKNRLDKRLIEANKDLVQGYIERDAEFASRKQESKEKIITEEQKKYEYECSQIKIKFQSTIANKEATKESIEKELLSKGFSTYDCLLTILDFQRESKPQYYPVFYSADRFNLEKTNGKIIIDEGDEQTALYINSERENFKARINYRVIKDNTGAYQEKPELLQIIDQKTDRIFASFDLNKKYEPPTPKQKDKEKSSKDDITNTNTKIDSIKDISITEVKKEIMPEPIKKEKFERFTNSLCSEYIVGGSLNNIGSDNNWALNFQFYPISLYHKHFTFKTGCGISWEIKKDNFAISPVLKSGLNWKWGSIDLGTGALFSEKNFEGVIFTAELNLRVSNAIGFNMAYVPELFFEDSSPHINWTKTITLGMVFYSKY